MELLGADESVIATLTPGDQFVDDDPTQQSTELKLPEDECVGCAVGDHSGQTLSLFWYSQATGHVITLSLLIPLLILLFQIRLIREAAEWGPRYKFWSCADVDIVKVCLLFTNHGFCILNMNFFRMWVVETNVEIMETMMNALDSALVTNLGLKRN